MDEAAARHWRFLADGVIRPMLWRIFVIWLICLTIGVSQSSIGGSHDTEKMSRYRSGDGDMRIRGIG